MKKETVKVIKGYSELTYDERREVREFIEKYERKDYDDRKPEIRSLCESVGPLDSGACPCCGR